MFHFSHKVTSTMGATAEWESIPRSPFSANIAVALVNWPSTLSRYWTMTAQSPLI